MTRQLAGKLDGVPFAIDRDAAGAEQAYVCLDCGLETKPSAADFMKEHGSSCKDEETVTDTPATPAKPPVADKTTGTPATPAKPPTADTSAKKN